MLECQALGKTYPVKGRPFAALSEMSWHFKPGSFTALIGASGCGKTTLLRLLAGLTEPSAGIIRHATAHHRTGYVFQEPRLMPWLNVEQNIAFTLKGQLPADVIDQRVHDMLELMQLAPFAAAYPHQLSGGMASRVGLARALVGQPQLLLLDEPFAALDAFTRQRLQQELLTLCRTIKPTTIFVTHDVEEAILLADHILHLDRGRLVHHAPVDIPFPRDVSLPAVVQLRADILQRLTACQHQAALHSS